MSPTEHHVDNPKRRRLLVSGAAALAAMAAPVAATFPASASSAASATFTSITSSANPVLTGVHFQMMAMECDRVANVHATGMVHFFDVTSGGDLGSVALTPDPTFVNCSDASTTNWEPLSAGTYRIKAVYAPGGTTPVPQSNPAAYNQVVENPAFTDISWTSGATVPNPHVEGAAVSLGGRVYDISGSTGDCTDSGCGSLISNVDVYNPTTNKFKSAPKILNPRTGDPAAVVVAGKIYVLGGTDASFNTVSAIDVYSPASGWSTLPAASDLPAGFTGQWSCAAADGSNIYYFDNATQEIGVLDTAASPPSWTVGSPQSLLNPSRFCSAVESGPSIPSSSASHIVLVGPGNGSADANSQRVLIYTPATGKLALAQGTGAATAEQSAAKLEGTVVSAGGDFNDLGVEGVAPGQGSVTTYSSLPSPRDDAAGGSVVNNRFYIVGGVSETTSGDNNTPAVLIGTPN
jgi:hypothetical protein